MLYRSVLRLAHAASPAVTVHAERQQLSRREQRLQRLGVVSATAEEYQAPAAQTTTLEPRDNRPAWLRAPIPAFGKEGERQWLGLDERVQMPEAQDASGPRTFMRIQGTLDQRIVNDERHLVSRHRPTVVAESEHDAGGNMRHGTLRALRRAHWIRLQHGLNMDAAVSQRHERMNLSSWGRIVPLLWQLKYATKSADIRAGRVGAVAVGARTLDAHVVSVGPEHPIDRTTRAQIQRQLQHELATFLPALKATFATTATAPLAARFLALHTEFDVPVPSAAAVENATKRGQTVPALHRHVFRQATELVATDLEQRVEALSLSPAASADSAEAASEAPNTERAHARLAAETQWIAAEAEQVAAWIESTSEAAEARGGDEGSSPELELVGRLKLSVERSRAVAAEWPTSDSTSPMLTGR